MARKKQSENNKKLNKPIKIDPTKSYENGEMYNDVYSQIKEKLGILMNQYNIDPTSEDCWYWLSYKLAEQYVPGFKIIPPKVNMDGWNGRMGFDFYFDIRAICWEGNCTVEAAIKKYLEQNGLPDTCYDNYYRNYYAIADSHNSSSKINNHFLLRWFNDMKKTYPHIESLADADEIAQQDYESIKDTDLVKREYESYKKNFDSGEING